MTYLIFKKVTNPVKHTMKSRFLVSSLNRLGVILLLSITIGVLYSTPSLAWMQAKNGIGLAGYLIAAAIAFATACATFGLKKIVYAAIHDTLTLISKPSSAVWLSLIIALGVLARISWALFFPSVFTSDGAAYCSLANLLLSGQPYEMAGAHAFWPPGYPFFLVPWLALPIDPKLAVLISNLALYCATVLVVFRLGRRAGGESVARLATLLIMIWPSYLANAGLPEKENFLILLLPLALYLYIGSHQDAPKPALRIFAAGLVLGIATLAQPSVQLFFTVFLCFELLSRTSFGVIARRIGILLFAVILVIAPWTARNMMVLHAPVIVSTNGGDNLYRANNDLATGAYTSTGTIDLSALPELDRNREGFRLAREWIYAHPKEFIYLIGQKEIYFLGDDTTGLYNTLRRGGGASNNTYIILKVLANAIWYGFWLVMLVFIWRLRSRIFATPVDTTLVLAYGYFFVLHSIFESGGKYHLPAVSFLAILFSIFAVRSTIGVESNSAQDTLPINRKNRPARGTDQEIRAFS